MRWAHQGHKASFLTWTGATPRRGPVSLGRDIEPRGGCSRARLLHAGVWLRPGQLAPRGPRRSSTALSKASRSRRNVFDPALHMN